MRSRVLALALLGLLIGYLCWSVFGPFRAPLARWGGIAATLAAFGSILWVPLVFWRRESGEMTERDRWILAFAFAAMGLLSFLLVLSLARDLLALLTWASPLALRTPALSLAILAASAALLGLGAWIAHHGVRLKRVRVPLPGLPTALQGLRILQISDLHAGPSIRRAFIDKVVRIANEAEPDLVVLTGDLADGMVRDLVEQTEPLGRLRAPLGRFYVPGNHEYYWEGPAWIERLRALGAEPLLNEHRVLSRGGASLVVAGVPDPTAASMGLRGPDVAAALAGAPASAGLRILLCHQPRFASEAERAGADLFLCGHTHGGQFFPWTLVAARVHRFNAGLHRLGRLAVYVSRGTGFWGPPVRIGSPPEVTLLELAAAD